MTIHLHDYGDIGLGAGGAPINYAEVSRLLLTDAGLATRRHDFFALIAAGDCRPLTSAIGRGDTLVATIGPWAHLYYHWREISGTDFRIVRDARTTAWAPYLAQEWLAGPLVREGDLIVFPSEFTRTFYRRLFPHITAENSRVLYPLAGQTPPLVPRAPGPTLRIGCLGRIADDKNILDALKVLAHVRRERPAELHLAGPFYPRSRDVGSRAALDRAVRAAGLPREAVVFHGELPHREIWKFLAGVDVVFFPALSSNESFGRVIVEAGRAGVPVIATDFAAAPELLPAANLVSVRFRRLRKSRLSQPFSLGEPDAQAAAAALLATPSARDVLTELRYSGAAFTRMVTGGDPPEPARFEPSPGVRAFLDGVTVDGIGRLSRAEASSLCTDQARFMRRLYDRRATTRLRALVRLLPRLPGDPTLRRVARERLLARHPAGLLRNAVASGRVLGFDPRLSLEAVAAPARR